MSSVVTPLTHRRIAVPPFTGSVPISDYVQQFLVENRRLDRKFSTRFFSAKLGWPRSLLTDVANGRKRLSALRAIEFCEFLAFTERQTQIFVLKALCEGSGARVESFLERFVLQNFSHFLSAEPSPAESELVFDALASAVLTVVQAKPGITEPSIIENLDVFTPTDLLRVPKVIANLLSDGWIVESGGMLSPTAKRPLVVESIRQPDNPKTPQSFVAALARFVELRRPTSHVAGATVALSSRRIAEIKSKIDDVRDWTIAASELDRAADSAKAGTLIPVQLLLSVFSLSKLP